MPAHSAQWAGRRSCGAGSSPRAGPLLGTPVWRCCPFWTGGSTCWGRDWPCRPSPTRTGTGRSRRASSTGSRSSFWNGKKKTNQRFVERLTTQHVTVLFLYNERLTTLLCMVKDHSDSDDTYHSLCYTSRGALAGTRNSSKSEGRNFCFFNNALNTFYLRLYGVRHIVKL